MISTEQLLAINFRYQAVSLKVFSISLLAVLLFACTAIPVALHAAQARTVDELISFAFARYLGTGFYTTGDSRVFVLQLPLTRELKPMTDDDPGLVLHYPFTIGFTDFSIGNVGDSDIPNLNDIVTLSLVPGIELRYRIQQNWVLAPFFDLGVAHDLQTSLTLRILGVGIKSFASFKHGTNEITLGNRLLYADESRLDIDGNSNFAVFETGLDYRIPADMHIGGEPLDLSLYYINYYYLNELVIVRILDNPIKLTNKNEIGFTFRLPSYDWLPEKPRLGFGVQFAGELRVYRIVFGMPFF